MVLLQGEEGEEVGNEGGGEGRGAVRGEGREVGKGRNRGEKEKTGGIGKFRLYLDKMHNKS